MINATSNPALAAALIGGLQRIHDDAERDSDQARRDLVRAEDQVAEARRVRAVCDNRLSRAKASLDNVKNLLGDE